MMPAALDLVAFMGIWTALGGRSMRAGRRVPVQRKRRRPRAPQASMGRRVANHKNIVPFNAA